jgi:2-isopropylmalate synthase
VRDLTPQKGSAAKVRVIIELDNKNENWSAVGVSDNIIKASWLALRDGIDYSIIKGA